MKIQVRKLHPDAIVPAYATAGSAGFDIVAIEDCEIEPGKTMLLRTGLAFEIPEGFELQIRPRSGRSLSTPFRVANSPGTVDSDFRGEVCIVAHNISGISQLVYTRDFDGRLIDVEGAPGLTIAIKTGDRVAQGIICPVVRVEFEETDRLSLTERSAHGFGSTGGGTHGSRLKS